MPKKKEKKCKGSGTVQMLTWYPSESDGYPGAVVCLQCSQGILVKKNSVFEAVSESGHKGLAGTVRVHNR